MRSLSRGSRSSTRDAPPTTPQPAPPVVEEEAHDKMRAGLVSKAVDHITLLVEDWFRRLLQLSIPTSLRSSFPLSSLPLLSLSLLSLSSSSSSLSLPPSVLPSLSLLSPSLSSPSLPLSSLPLFFLPLLSLPLLPPSSLPPSSSSLFSPSP